MLRLTCEVDLLDIEEQNFGELSNALGENDALAVIDVDESGGYTEEEPVVMQISNDIAYIMMDRMLGGTGELIDDTARAFTAIELAMYNDIFAHIIPLMSDAWKNYFNVRFSFSNIEVNPRLMQRLSIDAVVVIIVMNITINDTTGKVNICLPGNVFEFILEALEANKLSGRRKDSHGARAADDILYNISGSALEIKVDLGESQVMLSDIVNLKKGDIINLRKPHPSPAIVYIEDKPWFTAELGREKNNKAVTINGFITNKQV
jgi:flagellar motor switch protein FliM